LQTLSSKGKERALTGVTNYFPVICLNPDFAVE